MSQWALKNRLLKLRISVCICAILCLIAVIQFFTAYGKYNYAHLPKEVIETHLFKQVSPNIVFQKNKPDCKYDEILKSTKSLKPSDIQKLDNFKVNGIVKGSYVPEQCNPVFSVAIIVMFRNRPQQLDVFLRYMHAFLRKQNIHYNIYVVEQQDERPFNRGLLCNIGAEVAITDKFPCLIFHDVDLLPLDTSNLYVCTNQPRHMSASIDKFRYVLTYDTIVGGVLAIKSYQFAAVNGFSNRFDGWGGEDDDLSMRLSFHQVKVVRFPREMSRYTMMLHRQELRNSFRSRIISENRQRRDVGADGLRSLSFLNITKRLVHQRLFTLIGVQKS